LLHQSLNLAGRHGNAAGFPQVLLGLLVAGFIGTFQACQASQGRSVAALQSEGGIGRVMSLLFCFIVIVVALERKGPKNTIDHDRLSALA